MRGREAQGERVLRLNICVLIRERWKHEEPKRKREKGRDMERHEERERETEQGADLRLRMERFYQLRVWDRCFIGQPMRCGLRSSGVAVWGPWRLQESWSPRCTPLGR